MLNVNLKALGVDTFASSSHKWMLAPKGSGLLYIRREVQDRVQPGSLYSGYKSTRHPWERVTSPTSSVMGWPWTSTTPSAVIASRLAAAS